MNLLSKSYIAMAILFCVSVSNSSTAEIAWSLDLVPGSEMNASPFASCLDKNAESMFVAIKTYPKGSFSNTEGDIVLLEIDNMGHILREVVFADESGNKIRTDALPMGFAMVSDYDGNLFIAGKSFTQTREARYRINISTDTATDPNILQINFLSDYSIQKIIDWSDGTFIAHGKGIGDGRDFLLRLDSQGNVLFEDDCWFKKDSMIADVIRQRYDNAILAIVGSTWRSIDDDSFEKKAENHIWLYDVERKSILLSQSFTGAVQDFPGWLLLPKVRSLENGNILVLFYNKPEKNAVAGLWMRRYSQEMELLQKKRLLDFDATPSEYGKLPLYYDVVVLPESNFAVAILQSERINFHVFNAEGVIKSRSTYEGMVSASGFNLMQIKGTLVTVFEEGGFGNIDTMVIKTKVIAIN